MFKTPTISQYLEAMNAPYQLFRTLGHVVPQWDERGELSFCAGNYAVIFKVRCEDGKHYALKCYIRLPRHLEQIYSSLHGSTGGYLVAARYLPDELYLFEGSDGGSYYPVTLMDWVEGQSLGTYAGILCREEDVAAIATLAVKFDQMAQWLLSQEFAHGDLKQDNLLVTPDGDLRLIDYDGAFVPELAGEKSGLRGSPAYQHPLRNEHCYDRWIDDYSIALISLSLHALSHDPGLFDRYHDGENLIFDAHDLQRGRCALFDQLMKRWRSEGFTSLVSLGLRMQTPDIRIEGLSDLLSHSDTVTIGSCLIIDEKDPRSAIFYRDGLYGYMDLSDHRILLRNIYEDATPFREDVAVVRHSGRFEVIDRRGRCLINCSAYEEVSPFSDGLSRVRRNGLYGFMNHDGVCVIEERYLFATRFREGLSVVRDVQTSKYGYINIRGEAVTEMIFDHAESLRNGKARVEQDGKTYYVYYKV